MRLLDAELCAKRKRGCANNHPSSLPALHLKGVAGFYGSLSLGKRRKHPRVKPGSFFYCEATAQTTYSQCRHSANSEFLWEPAPLSFECRALRGVFRSDRDLMSCLTVTKRLETDDGGRAEPDCRSAALRLHGRRKVCSMHTQKCIFF